MNVNSHILSIVLFYKLYITCLKNFGLRCNKTLQNFYIETKIFYENRTAMTFETLNILKSQNDFDVKNLDCEESRDYYLNCIETCTSVMHVAVNVL